MTHLVWIDSKAFDNSWLLRESLSTPEIKENRATHLIYIGNEFVTRAETFVKRRKKRTRKAQFKLLNHQITMLSRRFVSKRVRRNVSAVEGSTKKQYELEYTSVSVSTRLTREKKNSFDLTMKNS